MIVFDLQCARGHQFEGWFDDNRAFEDQKKRQLILCPVCNDSNVCKIPSAFAIGSSRTNTETETNPELRPPDPAALARKISHFLENSFDNVGSDFAKEALKIHYGAEEPRNIRGVSTSEEEKMLKEEGIRFFKIPAAPPSSEKN
ncbi:MAG: DUF1178 family protein [Desulfococcaceae bacterium]|jgi:hypothetical protein|nr:DUF1178 family protein [Desulfococcaceae bacterium]